MSERHTPERVWIRPYPRPKKDADYGVWMSGGPYAGHEEYVRVNRLTDKSGSSAVRRCCSDCGAFQCSHELEPGPDEYRVSAAFLRDVRKYRDRVDRLINGILAVEAVSCTQLVLLHDVVGAQLPPEEKEAEDE